MTNPSQALAEELPKLEAQEGKKSPESGERKKAEAPKSAEEAKTRIAEQDSRAIAEAEGYSTEVLQGNEEGLAYDQERSAIDAKTKETVKFVTLAADAKLAQTVGAEAIMSPAAVEAPKPPAAVDEIPVTHEEPVDAEPTAEADDGSVDVDLEDLDSVDVDLEGSDAEDFETKGLNAIKARTEDLDRLYAIPADKRTAKDQRMIEGIELSNGITRKTIEKHHEEVKLKALEARKAELEDEITSFAPKPPSPGSTEEIPITEDDVAFKQQALADVVASIVASKEHIIGLGSAIAQLDRIRKRMKRPEDVAKAGVAAKKPDEPKAETKPAVKGGGGGSTQIEYGKHEVKEEKHDDRPDILDKAIGALHGNL